MCYLEVKDLPLKAIIDGGEYRKVIKNSGITLSAKRSYDPNEPKNNQDSLRLKWTCVCITKDIPNCDKTCKYLEMKSTWLEGVEKEFYIYPYQIQYNAKYKFQLTLHSVIKYPADVSPKYDSVVVEVANKSVTVVTNYYIDCIQNCNKEEVKVNEIIFLKAKVQISGEFSPGINDSIAFEWAYAMNNESVFQPLDSMKIDGMPSHMLAVKEDSFKQGTTYTINLKEKNASENLAQYIFITSSAEYSGNCVIEPTSGVKGLTDFDITCDGFQGFIFEFYDKSDEDVAKKVIFNGRMLGTSEFFGTLEDVKITRGNVQVYIINKKFGLFQTKELKVELSPWNITEEELKEIETNLTSTIRLQDLKSTMNYVSFIPDILPESADKSKFLNILLEPISQAELNTIADVKLSASTMKIVLETLNKPSHLSVDLALLGQTLVTIRKQADVIKKAVKERETSRWMPSQEIRLVATALLDCLNTALRCEKANTEHLTEENLNFNSLFTLIKNAKQTEETLNQVKDILCYIHAPGLPPVKLASSDDSFQVWGLGYDEEFPLSDMLKTDDNIPFCASQALLDTYSKAEELDTHLFFQAALIERNIFSWSKSDVKSKLVSFNTVRRSKGEDLKKMHFLSTPIHVKIDADKNMTKETISGSALQLDPSIDPEDLDLKIAIHRLDCPPKGFITIRFLFPPTNGSLRVLLMEEFRPVYELMTSSKDVVIINSANSEVPINHRSVDLQIFLYMGILPEKDVPVNQTVEYAFEVSLTVCQLWIQSQWSSIGCSVSVHSTSNETVCECHHLSIFAAAFPVPPQSIDLMEDMKLFLKVLDNPLIVTFVIIIFIIYLMLVLWGRYKDNIDYYKGKVVVLEDNFPEDMFPYLVAVHTSARFNAGTTAHVGIKILGEEGNSRAHILTSENRKLLKRNSDDWFMIYSPKSLGAVHGIHVWHDNYGSRPEWYCDKIVAYDLSNSTESVFIVEQWLALREGDFPEAKLVIASDQDLMNIKRMFLDNALLGFRDSHTLLSVIVRHPRSEVTRVQRVSILMCCIMVAMLCSIMFYTPPDLDNPTDDFQYDVKTRDIIISIQTLFITAGLTLIVLISFKRSYKVLHEKHRTVRQIRHDQFAEAHLTEASHDQGKSLYDNYVQYISKYFKNPPLAPVSIWESDKKVQRRKIWYTIAWFFCIVIILVAAFFVMLYGLKLGFVQSQKWLTSLVMTMGEDIFIMGPGRIIIIAILLSMAFQLSTKVDLHGIGVGDAMVVRPKNELNYLNILLAKRNHPMYAPLSSSARMALLKKQQIRRKWWNVIDFMNSVFYIIVVSAVIYRLWTSYFHGVNHLSHMFSLSGKEHFGSIDIDKIKDIPMVESYLGVTFFEVMFNSWWYNNQPMAKVENGPEGIQKYWAKDSLYKMITNPYVRQVRVVPHDCTNIFFKNMRKCLLKWSLKNKDTNVYSENWAPATYLDVGKKSSPWEYKDLAKTLWWTNQRFYGASGKLYDASGYETHLGPTLKEAQKTLGELQQDHWQDWYTRACFLTVTVFNVNQQMFSQVTMLFEYFVDGSMSSSCKVIPVSRKTMLGVWEYLFLIYAIYYVFRSGYLINRMGLIDYLKNLNNFARVLNVFLAFLVIILWYAHHNTSNKYTNKYMKGQLGDYFDFDKFISTFTFVQIALSLLLCFAISRTFMLLRGGRRFLNTYYAFIISLSLIFWLSLVFLVVILVIIRLQYFFHCQEYFRIKELILSQKMTAFLIYSLLEHGNVQAFVFLRVFVMWFFRALFLVSFLYNIKVAKVYKLRESDSFNLVLFVIERVKRCCGRKKSMN